MSTRQDARSSVPAAHVNVSRSRTARTPAYEDAIFAAVEEEQPGNSSDIPWELGLILNNGLLKTSFRRIGLITLYAECISSCRWSASTPTLRVTTSCPWPDDLVHCTTWWFRVSRKINVSGHMVYVVRIKFSNFTFNKKNSVLRVHARIYFILHMNRRTPAVNSM